MNSGTVKRRKGLDKDNGNDRLSELPDNVLLHILSFLPTVDAVRTVAIRSFGSLWTRLPSLRFVEYELPSSWANDEEVFANFVRNVLFLHKRVPIDSFKLCFGDEIDLDDPDLDYKFFLKEITAWIRCVIDRQVKNLDIDIRVDGAILPRSIFTSQFLVVLKLGGFNIDELSRVQMKSLTKLSFDSVEVSSNEVLNKIILGSPSLQELDLRYVTGLDELRFTTPNFRKLTLEYYEGLLDCPNLKILDVTYIDTLEKVVDVSSIREVNFRHSRDSFKVYMKKFSNAEVFRYFGVQLPDSEQDFPETRWKCLHIIINSMLNGD